MYSSLDSDRTYDDDFGDRSYVHTPPDAESSHSPPAPDFVMELRTYLKTSRVQWIDAVDHVDVAPYRMKKVRDHHVFSQMKREMLDNHERWIIAMTLKVIKRALRGKHCIISILMCPEVIDSVKEDIKKAKMSCAIMIAPRELIHQIVGLEINKIHSIAALINLPSIPLLLEETPSPAARSGPKVEPEQEAALQTKNISSVSTFRAERSPSSSSYSSSLSTFPSLTTNHKKKVGFPMLILDDVRSSDNIGVVIRTAYSFGIPTLLCTQTSFAGINARSSRVSLGALFHFDIYTTPNLPDTIRLLRNHGIVVLGTSPTATEPIYPMKTRHWAIVMGNEEEGASTDTLQACTQQISIPQIQGDSLSVVTANAICLYELSKDYVKLNSNNFVPDI